MTALLIPEPPLQVLPSLAKEVGLNEAIVLQQLHYWRLQMGRDEDETIYNTIEDWKEQFPFWSERTIRRIIERLREKGYVEVSQPGGIDRTNHYRVLYDALPQVVTMAASGGQSGPMSIRTETTFRDHEQSSSESSSVVEASEVRDVFDHWSELYSPRSKFDPKRKRRIAARLSEGFTAEELKRAITNASGDEWLNGSHPDSPGYLNKLDTLLRDAAQVERLRDLGLPPSGPASETANQIAIRQLREQGLHEEADELEEEERGE
jgi:hypothetical protein